jgi:glycine cleavage system H protein
VRIPDDRRYAETHEWAKLEGTLLRVGLSDYAQEELGDIVLVDLPEAGTKLAQGEGFGVIESVKAVNDLYAPVSGEVTEVHAELDDRPELVNEDPYGAGWLMVIRPSDPTELDSLMGAADYEKLYGEEEGA